MEQKRYRIAKKKVILIFILVGLLIESGVISALVFAPLAGLGDFNLTTTIIIGIGIAVLMSVFCVMAIKNSYYLIENKGIRCVRPGKDLFYTFDSIIYVDEAYSEKHKVVLAYTNEGREILIPFDEEAMIYKAILNHSKNLVSKEEYLMRFPSVKL